MITSSTRPKTPESRMCPLSSISRTKPGCAESAIDALFAQAISPSGEGAGRDEDNLAALPLIFVPTPLGNLGDITLRALDTLRACDLVVAEDTRVARRLLAAYEIAGKTLWSYREQNAAGATPQILERARSGRVAVVTDAGTPGISDPGRELIVAARDAGIAVEVLPGAVAFVTAAVLS